MKQSLISLCSIASIGAVAVAIGCPVLKDVDVPCESSYDCPTGSGCGDNKTCVAGLRDSTLTISPVQAEVTVSASTNFAVTTNGRSVEVDWSVDSPDGTMGSIGTTGLYVAPNVVPSPDTVTVWATSKRHSELRVSAMVRILELPDAGQAHDAGNVNVVPDPGFEENVATVWSSFGSASAPIKSTDSPHSGAKCLCVPGSYRSLDWNGPLLKLDKFATPGNYGVDAWIRVRAAPDAGIPEGTLNLKIDTIARCPGPDGGIVDQGKQLYNQSNFNTGEWIELASPSFVVPSCVADAGSGSSLDFYFDGPPGGAEICIDDVIIWPISD
jgi:hypothetical protein